MTELVQKGTLPTLEQPDDTGKVVTVNPAGTNYVLGTAQSGASVASLDSAQILTYCNSGSSFGAAASCPIKGTGTTQATATSVLQTVAAGAGNGFHTHVVAPTFTEGTLTAASGEIAVSNEDGTEKLILGIPDPVALTSNTLTNLYGLAGYDVVEQIGTDLAVAANGQTIDSTAGGQFTVSVSIAFGSTGLVA